MSGRKCSSYQLTQEQQTRNVLAISSRAAQRRIFDLVGDVERQRQSLASEGGAAEAEIALAAAWLKSAQADPALHRAPDATDTTNVLENDSRRLERIEAEGIQRSRELKLAQVRRAVARRKAEAEAAARAQEKLAHDRFEAASGLLARLMAEANPGLQESFPQEAAALRQATGQLKAAGNDRGARLESALAAAAAAGAAWNAAMVRAEELKAAAQTRIQAIQAGLGRGREPLNTWFGSEYTAGLEHELAKAQRALENSQLIKANGDGEELATRIRQKLEECDKLEDQQQRRAFVSESLVKACEQLSFGIVEAPSLEEAGNPRSPMRLVVDTFDEGQIVFRITLDSIESDSCMSKSYCFNDFDRLSQQLESQFGITTRFEMADGSPRPRFRAEGGLDEPGGRQAVAGKS